MKKNWIRLLTMLLAAMLILTMSGVVSLANDDQPSPVTAYRMYPIPISPVKTEEEPSVDESSTGASSEDEGSKGPSSEDVSSEGSSSEDASSKDASSEDSSSKDANSKDISSEECTCGAAEGEVHKEGCPLYTEPEEKPSEAVQAVIDMIEALPDADTVTVADADAVRAAMDAFDALSPDDQVLVTNADKLDAVVGALAGMPATMEDNGISAVGPIRIFYQVDGGTEQEAGTAVQESKYFISSPALTNNFNTVTIRVEANEGYTFEEPSAGETKIENVEISFQHTSKSGVLINYDFGKVGSNESVTIPASLLGERVKSDDLYIVAHLSGVMDVTYYAQNFLPDFSTSTETLERFVGSYVSSEDAAGQLTVFKKDGKLRARIEKEVNKDGGQAESSFGELFHTLNYNGSITSTRVKFGYGVNAYFEVGEDAGRMTLTAVDDYSYRMEAGDARTGKIERGTVFTAVPVPDIAQIGGIGYPSLDAAVKAAKKGDVIKLLSGYTAETADDIVTIPEGLSITLDLAGKTINVGSTFVGRPLINRGTLTITGNGTIDSSASLSGRGAIDNYGVLTVENGTYLGNVAASGAGVMNRSEGTVIINGGTFDSATCALYNLGVATVNGGTFNTISCNKMSAYSYCVRSEGELYFNNGSVTGVQGALSINAGYAEVKDGSFQTLRDEHTDDCSFYAIYIAGEVGKVEAHVYGGTFKSASKVAILVGNDNTGGDGGINAKATAYISGGTFIGGNGKALDAGTNTGNPSITGGTFNSDVTKYVAAGYVCEKQSDGSYKVSPGASVAQIGSTVYPNLAAAITAAKNGDTITLLADVKEDPVAVDKAVTIDGNGKEFTGTMVVSAGGVTIKNTVFTGTGIVPKDGRNGANHLIKVTCDGMFTFTGNTIRGVDAKTADGQDGIYYDYINIAASGVVTITGNTFDANGGKVYNGIECSQSIPLASGSKIANNTFAKGDCTHNSINIYKVADGGSYDVSGNTFAYSGNAFRLSNYPNADGASPRATFNMNNTTYHSTDETDLGYAGLICLQDPTNQNGKFEDFTKFTIHLANLKGPGGEILTKNELGTAKQVFYVYRDKSGIDADATRWPVVPEFINTDEEIAGVVAGGDQSRQRRPESGAG